MYGDAGGQGAHAVCVHAKPGSRLDHIERDWTQGPRPTDQPESGSKVPVVALAARSVEAKSSLKAGVFKGS